MNRKKQQSRRHLQDDLTEGYIANQTLPPLRRCQKPTARRSTGVESAMPHFKVIAKTTASPSFHEDRNKGQIPQGTRHEARRTSRASKGSANTGRQFTRPSTMVTYSAAKLDFSCRGFIPRPLEENFAPRRNFPPEADRTVPSPTRASALEPLLAIPIYSHSSSVSR